ncbi:hypothetical protein [Streptomyces luteireticuli]|uniref:Uncharacterized protein n=1 Tax=Streptomyces luteireticuli TaxID=173858 RepID=A0ABP3I9M4_9ACTN
MPELHEFEKAWERHELIGMRSACSIDWVTHAPRRQAPGLSFNEWSPVKEGRIMS